METELTASSIVDEDADVENLTESERNITKVDDAVSVVKEYELISRFEIWTLKNCVKIRSTIQKIQSIWQIHGKGERPSRSTDISKWSY